MGKIILLNTPIGNLGDLTPRVSEALRSGELFAAEDTRVFKDLLNHLGISLQGKRVFSLHDQSGTEQVHKLLEMVTGHDLYVTSDAGSPIISDPAYPLVVAAYEKGLTIESYSGVSSPVMALELSGLPPIPFHFHGFLPREENKKSKAFKEMPQGTNIYFDAPTRIEETLDLLAKECPEHSVAVVRELSKKFQQVMRFKASAWPAEKGQMVFKGEFILLIHEAREGSVGMDEDLRKEALAVLQGGGPKQVAKLLSQILDRPTKEIYSELNRNRSKVEE